MMPVIGSARCQKIKTIISEYTHVSTVQGLSNIFRSEKNISKLTWLIIFLTSISFTIYMVVDTINSYLEYEIVTKVEIVT